MKKITKAKAIKAYKVFNSNWQCRGFQFEVGKTYKHEGTVKICSKGFHACLQVADCFSYYSFESSNKVAEVLIWGNTDTHNEDSKICGAQIQIVREVEWSEVLALANTGKDNTGLKNSGDRNSGNSNSGNWNSGNSNSGDSNSGNRNSGAFCLHNNPECFLFDQPSGMRIKEWEQSKAYRIMANSLKTGFWIEGYAMTDQEKADHPKWETVDGYLKIISLHEAWANMWPNLYKDSRRAFLTLPNFNQATFEAITGLDVSADLADLTEVE